MTRNLILDITKLILIFMVVGIHTTFFIEYSELTSYLLVNGVFRISVPVFFIINGYFFSKIKPQKVKKWCKRLTILYLFWMLFYSFFWIDFNPVRHNSENLLTTGKYILIGYWHMWYILATLGAGITLHYFRRLPERFLILLGVILFLTGIVLQYEGNYHLLNYSIVTKITDIVTVHRNFLFFGFPFFLFGYLISVKRYETRFNNRTLLVLITAGSLLLISEAYMNYHYLAGYINFSILFSFLILAPSLFLLAIKNSKATNTKYFAHIANAIYFIHPLFIIIFGRYFQITGIYLTFIVILFSFVSAFLLIFANRKIRWLL